MLTIDTEERFRNPALVASLFEKNTQTQYDQHIISVVSLETMLLGSIEFWEEILLTRSIRPRPTTTAAAPPFWLLDVGRSVSLFRNFLLY